MLSVFNINKIALMDITLAKTFLEIVRCGSFISAAERLNVTQTTVTARVHNIESQLGCKLFIRNRSGATLTNDGKRFIEHATKLVQVWETAKRDLPLPHGTAQVLNIGCEISLWNPVMLHCLNNIDSHSQKNIAIRGEVGERQSLMKKLEHGELDIIVVHQPEYWPGVLVEELFEEKLILVSSKRSSEPYIFIDWGEAFRKQHDVAMPERARARLTLNLGPLALQYILEHGGSGYFRTRVVDNHLASGELHHQEEAPVFTYPAYVLYRQQDRKRLEPYIQRIRKEARLNANWQL